MRKTVEGGATRADAVWVNLAVEVIAKRLDSGEATQSDIVSIVAMHSDSIVLLDRQPHDWLLYNNIIDLLRTKVPLGPGNYLPALESAEDLLLKNTCGSCALLLLFLSDGAPSDEVTSKASPFRPEFQILKKEAKADARYIHVKPHLININFRSAIVKKRVLRIASRFGRRLTVGTIAFGGEGQDYSVLREMASVVNKLGAVGSFKTASMATGSLGIAISSLTASLTETKTELTALDGSTKKVRDVMREPATADDDGVIFHDEWVFYPVEQIVNHGRYDAHGEWVDLPLPKFHRSNISGIAMRKKYFGEGAERLVRKFRFVQQLLNQKWFVGPEMVCKESRFVEDQRSHKGRCRCGGRCGICDDATIKGKSKGKGKGSCRGSGRGSRKGKGKGKGKDRSTGVQRSLESESLVEPARRYHKSFCRSQSKAKDFANKFNEILTQLPGVDDSVPRITFLDCSVFTVQDDDLGEIGLLVEKRLDAERYEKWNNNRGYVAGQTVDIRRKAVIVTDEALLSIAEEDEEEESSDSDREAGSLQKQKPHLLSWEPADIPQAFSHFTYRLSHMEMLVCDLQGVLKSATHCHPCQSPVFELTDPAIHYKPLDGREHVFGRTDHRERGIANFFKSHTCSELCEMVGRRCYLVPRNHGNANRMRKAHLG
jgi:hypothetical protein